MSFSSFAFVGLFALTYALYLLLQSRPKLQNIVLLIASYFFYGYWDWRFLGLLAMTTLLNYWLALAIARTEVERERRVLVVWAAVLNLGILGLFKYFNFFADNVGRILGLVGLYADPVTMRLVLPVGISFYTFQTMSYTIDVYRRDLPATRRLLDFALFISFFPQLVAGPIERATNLLPQILSRRTIVKEQVDVGIYLILSGYFKKLVVADHMAAIANQVFNNYRAFHGLDVALGILAFTLQIYGDFSGYSDIARGLGKLMGFELTVNFRLPYFATNPSDFWERWHISLSSWLRDYLYIPLGGNRKGRLKTFRNLLVTMVLGGLWHGASWNFVLWGAFHGSILVAYRLLGEMRPHRPSSSGLASIVSIAFMFVLTCFGWLIFRSHSLGQFAYMLSHLGLSSSASTAEFAGQMALYAGPLVVVQLIQHLTGDLLVLNKLRLSFRVPVYGAVLTGIILLGVRKSMEFIYFQF